MNRTMSSSQARVRAVVLSWQGMSNEQLADCIDKLQSEEWEIFERPMFQYHLELEIKIRLLNEP